MKSLVQPSRQRREQAAPRQSSIAKWGNALVITLIVIGVLTSVAMWMFLIGSFVHR
jgi:hypothetical protein